MIKASILYPLFIICILRSAVALICPKHKGSDPQGINARIAKVASISNSYQVQAQGDKDEVYTYVVHLCQFTSSDGLAVTQKSSKHKDAQPINVGLFLPNPPDVYGGTDWIMIKYKNGQEYHNHCNKQARSAVVMLTCNPDVSKGTLRVLEEFRTNESTTQPGNPNECYYLFELNAAGACTVKPKKLSPGSVMVIIFFVVGSLYLGLGFLYMRFLVGAKGKEQLPNYSFWRDFGNLQADGCNFICRCTDGRPTRYKTMDDAIGDDNEEDERDDTLLPM